MNSDVDNSRWVMELSVRDREKDCTPNRALAAASLSDQDNGLKKAILLRTLECEVYDASVTETMLETLEWIEDLDIREGKSTMESMKAAYLAVATECTVKFLVGLRGKPGGRYLEAVDRIWRGRVRVLEQSGTSQMVSADLRQRRDEVEAGVWDLRVSKKLARLSSRNNALKWVAAYVKEALALMGQPVITWAIRLGVPKEVTDLVGDQITVANVLNVGSGSEVEDQAGDGANVGGQSGLRVPKGTRVNLGDGSELEAHIPNVEDVDDRSEMEAQMANGPNVSGESELEVQMAEGDKVGHGSELEGRMVNVGDSSELEAQKEIGPDVSGESELGVQMAKGAKVGDGSELEGQMVNRTNEGEGSQLEVQATNGTNAACESEQEAGNVRDGSELEAVNGANVGDGSQLEDFQTVNGTDVGCESHLEVQTMKETNVVGEPELDAQPECEFQGQMLKEASVNFGSELGPQPMAGVEVQEIGAGCSSPTVGDQCNDLAEMDSGLSNRKARKLGDDNVGSEVNGTGVALPSANRELAKDKEIQKNVALRHKRLARGRSSGPVKITDAEDLDKDLPNGKCDSPSTPEVRKAQEALKSSALGLQAVSRDSLRLAKMVSSISAMKSSNDVSGKHAGAVKCAEPLQSHNTTHNLKCQDSVGTSKQGTKGNAVSPLIKVEDEAPTETIAPTFKWQDTEGTDTESTDTEGTSKQGTKSNAVSAVIKVEGEPSTKSTAPTSTKSNAVSLLTKVEKEASTKSTAPTFTWQDPVDISEQGTNGNAVAPLTQSEDEAVTKSTAEQDSVETSQQGAKRNPGTPLGKAVSKRRKIKRWSLMEEDALRKGVSEHGAGSWKLILSCYRDMFDDRTEVDLKDKWRNMRR